MNSNSDDIDKNACLEGEKEKDKFVQIKKNKAAFPIDVKALYFTNPLKKTTLSVDERYELCFSVGVECIQPHELRDLIESNEAPLCYDGFEPSGRMHLAQGVVKTLNVNKLTKAGCIFVFWIADWFAMLNNKLEGSLKKIQETGRYFIEIWKVMGMDMNRVRFLWASEEINKHPNEYWSNVMDIMRKMNISRMKRCCQIMGRGDKDDQPAANILYPAMQCCDVLYLGADICQLGLDQRKVNMLAREYVEILKLKKKPVILSHSMLPGLLEGQEKMSKSNPDSAIFMDDSPEDVNRKIKKAYCPISDITNNPCVAYVEQIVFPAYHRIDLLRSEKNGGPVSYTDIEAFRRDYESGAIHPGDLKASLSSCINMLLDPVRKHFSTNEDAKQLLRKVKSFQNRAK